MSIAGDSCWTSTFPGRNPNRVLFGEQHVACTYINNQLGAGWPGPPTLVCLDHRGRVCWSMPDFQLLSVLHDDRFLCSVGSELRVLDADGRLSEGVRDGGRAVACKASIMVAQTRDRVVIKNAGEMLVTDRALNVVDRLPLPTEGRGVFAGSGLVYLDDDRVMFSDRWGHAELLCNIPIGMVYDAAIRWEEQTGKSALQGIVMVTMQPGDNLRKEVAAVRSDPSGRARSRMGQGRIGYGWGVSFVEATGALLLSSLAHPQHVIICLGLDGRPRWCTHLGPGCCSRIPTALPNGRLVVSSGCGGILSWLDSRGAVVARSEIVCLGEVTGMSDSGCIVNSPAGVVAYDASGTLRWVTDHECSCHDYDDRRNLLVTAAWADDEGDRSVSIRYLKDPGSQPSSA